MDKPAAIRAQLVDIRNIGHDKCVKLTLHVPAEQAPLVLEAFGWPTAVDPVPVALARLDETKESAAQPRPSDSDDASLTKTGRAHSKSWHEISPAQQAGILCREPSFQRFLAERVPKLQTCDPASVVRALCGVQSRSELNTNSEAAMKWKGLVLDYRGWMRSPEVV